MPLEAINAEAAREKSIRHGHPSTLHLWWARRPLAACRAVLFGQLVDDPSSVPEEFPTEEEQEKERKRLHALIAELVKWESSTDELILNKAKREIARSIARWRYDRGESEDIDEAILCGTSSPQTICEFLSEKAPPVYDPFCGGGSIPLEAQRLGLRATASDLNPVAVLITKALIEIPHRFAGLPPVNPESRTNSGLKLWDGLHGLAEDVRYAGKLLHSQAEDLIGQFYPKVTVNNALTADRPDLRRYLNRELTVVAWLWARTVRCPNPTCGAITSLNKSMWLSRKASRKVWLEVQPSEGRVRFNVKIGKNGPQEGNVKRMTAQCLCCEALIPLDYIRAEGQAKRLGQQLMAIVLEGDRERLYIPALPEHERIAQSVSAQTAPETMLPDKALGFRVQSYGMTRHRDLFTQRQLLALVTFCDVIPTLSKRIEAQAQATGLPNDERSLAQGGVGAKAYSEAVITYLSFALSKVADRGCSLSTWMPQRDSVYHAFARHALAMVWDFAEVNSFGDQTGGLLQSVSWVCESIEMLGAGTAGRCFQDDARATDHLTKNNLIIATDPPYYDNIGYADLSDFFYIWLRASLQHIFPDLFRTVLTPKEAELIASPHRLRPLSPKEFFEAGLRASFSAMRRKQAKEIPVTIFYAFKQEELDEDRRSHSSTGWDTMLTGLLDAGLTVDTTWPMRTELGNRPIGMGSNALASSIVFTCGARLDLGRSGTRKDLLTSLKQHLPSTVRQLQEASVAPVDLAQSAIGPGMGIFSRYTRILEPDGSSMSVRTALGLINQVLDEILAAEETDYDSDTRWAITWFTQFGFAPSPYGEAEILSKARNTSVQGLERAGIVEARAGKVRLLKREELEAWHPTTDDRFTIWEACQHLIKTLETEGEVAAARLLKDLDSRAGAARDLAYRLYQHCDRKGDAEEARAYNGLVVAWPRLAALAAEEPRPVTSTLDFS